MDVRGDVLGAHVARAREAEVARVVGLLTDVAGKEQLPWNKR